MSGKTFRSRWVVGWGVVFGGLCSGAAILMFMAAFRSGQATDSAADAEAKRIQKICEEQLINGGGSDDSRCSRTSGAGANEDVKGMLAASVLGALGAVQLIGAARIGVTLTGRGVIVRNPLRTHRLEWADIDRFYTEVGRARGMSYAFGRVDMVNGDTHRIEAISAMPWEDKNDFEDERVIAALNTELEAWRADPDRSEDELLSRFDFGDGPMRVYDMFVHDDDDREPPKVNPGDAAATTVDDDLAYDEAYEDDDAAYVPGDWVEGEDGTAWVLGEDGEWVAAEDSGDWGDEAWPDDGAWTDDAEGDAAVAIQGDAPVAAAPADAATPVDGPDDYDDPIGAFDDPIDSVRSTADRRD